ncbi:KxYKxGKxW signal peptide domain-containing protein, partial [Levilactobacillus spicheri]
MKQSYIGETKEHYKSYKAGKRWLYASITVLTLGLGTLGLDVSAHADTVDGDAGNTPAATQTDPDVTAEPAKQVTLSQPEQNDPSVPDTDTNTPTVTENSDNVEKLDAPVTTENQDNGEKSNTPAGTNSETPAATGQETPAPSNSAPAEQGQPAADSQATDPAATDPQPETTPAGNSDEVLDSLPTPEAAPAAKDAQTTKSIADIFNKDASEWMPDASLRDLVEHSIGYLNQGTVVNDANLYSFAGDSAAPIGITWDSGYRPAGVIKSLQGLEYFTNLTSIDLDSSFFDPSAMTDMSFAKNLNTFTLTNVDSVPVSWNQTGDEFMQNYLSTNTGLTWLKLQSQNLTGTAPDLSNYKKLEYVFLNDNQFTGAIPDYSALTNLTSIYLSENQLTSGAAELLMHPG